MFNDNDLIKYENISFIKRFTHPALNYSEGKSFVRGNIENLMMPTSHIPGINVFHFCNSKEELIFPKNFFGSKFFTEPKAYIKHFYTKTAEEFCDKLRKGDAHFHKNHQNYLSSIMLKLKLFFEINKKTREKVLILEKCTGINLHKYK